MIPSCPTRRAFTEYSITCSSHELARSKQYNGPTCLTVTVLSPLPPIADVYILRWDVVKQTNNVLSPSHLTACHTTCNHFAITLETIPQSPVTSLQPEQLRRPLSDDFGRNEAFSAVAATSSRPF